MVERSGRQGSAAFLGAWLVSPYGVRELFGNGIEWLIPRRKSSSDTPHKTWGRWSSMDRAGGGRLDV